MVTLSDLADSRHHAKTVNAHIFANIDEIGMMVAINQGSMPKKAGAFV